MRDGKLQKPPDFVGAPPIAGGVAGVEPDCFAEIDLCCLWRYLHVDPGKGKVALKDKVQNPERKIPMPDITFGHFESHKRIELRFPHATKLLWKTLASTTRRYLGNPEILAVLVEQKPDDAEDWACAQAALDRLATVPKPYISVREADNCLCFLASTCLFLKRNGTERKQIEAFLVLMAKITPCELEPLSPRPGNEWGKADRVVECYEHICKVVGASPSWISIYQVHSWWRQLTKYRGNSPDIIRLARRLGELCEPVRSVFGKTEI